MTLSRWWTRRPSLLFPGQSELSEARGALVAAKPNAHDRTASFPSFPRMLFPYMGILASPYSGTCVAGSARPGSQ